MVARAGGLLASLRLMDSVVFDLCQGPGTVAQVVSSHSRACIQRSSKRHIYIYIIYIYIHYTYIIFLLLLF
jgi:hypothetical protein